jgi:lipoate-protein ligase A
MGKPILKTEVTPRMSGPQNMRLDAAALADFEAGKIGPRFPRLRIYSWNPPCISLGYSQSAKKLLDTAAVKKLGWDIVKRPTGGGMVFHNTDEVTFSLILPYDYPGLPEGLIASYKYLAQAIIGALRDLGIEAEISANRHPGKAVQLGKAAPRRPKDELLVTKKSKNIRCADLCFSYPAEYEIVAAGKKIAGCAQKRGKKGFLQQGSIFVSRKSMDQFKRVLKGSTSADLDTAVCLEEIIGYVPDFQDSSKSLANNFTLLMKAAADD